MKRVRHYIFLRDVLMLAITAFGGPQAHIALFIKVLVKKRAYLTEAELIELNSFCQMLPGPASTQTLTAVGFKMGGPTLAFLTLLTWIFPAVFIMTFLGVFLSGCEIPILEYTRYVQIIAVGFVAYAAYRISTTVVNTRASSAILVISAVSCYIVHTPAIFPFVIIAGGLLTSFKYRGQPLEEKRERLKVEWSNFILYAAIFVGAALLGHFTRSLDNPAISKVIRIFENCFRNGSLTFGGGEALAALFFKQFVEFKQYLTREEFLSGYGVLKSLPGPLFSFSSYIGTLSMREYGLGGQIAGSVMAAAGIFLPGTILIFFFIRFWERLKYYRVVRASLEGINAASAGIVTATALILFQPLVVSGQAGLINYGVVGTTFLLLLFTKIPSPVLILIGLAAGFVF
ncbi:MAG TPA: chromate efflux transporter [Cytophagaceae bacterium]|nr:chromate efflux transporter [Cytophagaceae bacterium]